METDAIETCIAITDDYGNIMEATEASSQLYAMKARVVELEDGGMVARAHFIKLYVAYLEGRRQLADMSQLAKKLEASHDRY